MTKIGDFGSYFLIFTPIVLLLLFKKDFNEVTTILFSILVALIFMLIFKNIFQRIRPEEFFTIDQGGYSYPSGHSIVSASSYFTLYKLLKSKDIGGIFSLLLVPIPFLIGLSRLVLGVHWPTDVFFGLLLGLSISIISMRVYNKLKDNNG